MEINVHVQGITPLICNRFTEEAAMRATNGTRVAAPAAEQRTPLEIAQSKLYIGAINAPVIPQPNLLRCLVDGGRFHKAGKKQITTKTESMLYACLDIIAPEILIIHKQPWKVDSRPIVNPSTRGRFLTYRPMFDDWRLEFSLDLDTTLIAPSLLRLIVDDAGKRIGLGDFRPDRKGPYGRFRVDLWNPS